MILKLLSKEFSVIQVSDLSMIDFSISPLFIGKTEEETSVVLPTENVPTQTINREDHWKAFKIDDVLDFSLVGILAKISTLLAEKSISIFAISTYNTDYLLVKSDDLENAIKVFSNNEYIVKI
ncbi:ACT domain-containing protein [Ornithinibacillus sp. 4-3]|uniref:ACT domain-containing protein n=1 Tax=Ornithinibacillus sp. 4-3 TaxID=3231488 RepID=A0AB39HT47_9BACI